MLKIEKENIILVGGGGHCKACIDVIELEKKFNIIGILDDDESKIGFTILGYQIIGTSNQINDFKPNCNKLKR